MHDQPQKDDTTEGFKQLLVVQIPKSQTWALAVLNKKPLYHLGWVNFRVFDQGQEKPVSTEEFGGQT